MNTNSIQYNDFTVVEVSGNVTHAVADELEQTLSQALRAKPLLVIDLQAVRLLTSAGLRVLLLLHRQAAETGKRVALAGLSDQVRDVMGVTGFLEQFVTFQTVAEAVAPFQL
jgi:anti-sigma B factor antagonist